MTLAHFLQKHHVKRDETMQLASTACRRFFRSPHEVIYYFDDGSSLHFLKTGGITHKDTP